MNRRHDKILARSTVGSYRVNRTPHEEAWMGRIGEGDEGSLTGSLTGSVTDFRHDTEGNEGTANNSVEDGVGELEPMRIFNLLEEAVPRSGGDTETDEKMNRKENADATWEKIRRWLWAHPSVDQRRELAEIRSRDDNTAVHLMCKIHNPPEDVIQAMVQAMPEVASWAECLHWLPLHLACAYGCSPEVLRCLIQANPAGKLQPDSQGRTPLHFFATRTLDNVGSAEMKAMMGVSAELLSDSGAAEMTDRGGMLPMHYACAYGSCPSVLMVLAEAYHASLTAKEDRGRTPMHLAMVNAHNDASPGVIKFLLECPDSRKTINTRDHDGYLPLHLLALSLRGFGAADSRIRDNVRECLSMYLDAEPHASADFLTAIQDLPDWLQETAVVSKHVRNVLNDKIVQRFPTSFLMLDGYFLVILIVCFGFASKQYIDWIAQYEEDDPSRCDEEDGPATKYNALILLGASYFLCRELLQIASLVSMSNFNSWFKDPINWLDVAVIVSTAGFAIAMLTTECEDGIDLDLVRGLAAVTQGLLYTDVIVYLKNTLVDFAVFVGGVLYVLERLSAYMMAVGVILLAFAQMFFFLYLESDECISCKDDVNKECNPHCDFDSSLIKVYTMMMGEIDDECRYSQGDLPLLAQIFYVCFAFLVVILLSNVLIAIVTDSYEVIQNDKAAVVFWSNRLDFVAETDGIFFGAVNRLNFCLRREGDDGSGTPVGVQETRDGPARIPDPEPPSEKVGSTEFFRVAWQQMMLLFDANLFYDTDFFEALVYNIFRVVCIIFIIPMWIFLGFLSAGWLWPPQVRELLFAQEKAVTSRAEVNLEKLRQLKSVQTDMIELKNVIRRELENDREEMMRLKAEMDLIQNEVLLDLQQVREIMALVAQ